MREILFLISCIGFIWAFIKIELYFIYKSRESFRELKKAYKDLKKSKEDLQEFLK
jgi:hypothetical protein